MTKINQNFTDLYTNYQTNAGLSANVAKLSANNTSFVGSVSAANVVSNAQLIANLSNYQTTAGLSANIATLTANNTSFVGTVSAANVVSNAQLQANLSAYQTLSGLPGNVLILTSNNALNLGGTAASGYQTTAGLAANVAGLASNSSTYANSSSTNTFTVGTAAYHVANGNMGIGTNSPAVKLAISSTDAMLVPVGNTAQRPTGAAGYLRFNSNTSSFEGHNGTAWGSIGGGATGTGMDQIFNLNGQTVTGDYSIPSGLNAGTFGPISINSGVTVTVPSGSTWSII